MPSFSDPRLVCRPSLPSDTADVLAFTKRIWEGRDYIHLVWDEWLADPRGLLVSAQFGPRVVGIAVPGMPIGAPGMETPGQTPERYQVLTFDRSGRTAVFASR